MKLNGMFAFARNSLENQPGVGGNQQCGEPWRGKGFANILPDPLCGEQEQ